MWKHVSHRGATDRANKTYFPRKIWTLTAKYLKYNQRKLRYSNEVEHRIKDKVFLFKPIPIIHGRYTARGKSEWIKTRKWEV